MTELRWILLALGVLFCAGLWWWESRRGRQATDANADMRTSDPFPALSAVAREPQRRPEPEAPVLERDSFHHDEDVIDEKLRIQDEPEVPPRPRFAAPASGDPTDDALNEPGEAPFFTRSGERNARIEPTMGPVDAVERSAPPGETPATVAEERIVTVRVASTPLERFDGPALVRALSSAGLEHGRFAIFHRIDASGHTLFSVASLVEPGTFDLDALGGRRFPGVSFFAVLRRPAEALEVFDEMLNTARELAHEMHGALQDERGMPLSLQRLSTLREDVAEWQRAAMKGSA